MRPTTKLLLFLALVAATTSTSFTTHATSTGTACVPRERGALLVFKRGITSDPAGVLASWQRGGGQDCCRWRGVRCSNQTGHVLELQLRSTSTYGYPDDETALVGQISRSLLSLKHLEYLDLSFNELQGYGGIPEFLASFKNLRYLNLSGIPFDGRVPPQLGNLSKLQYLDLSGMSDYTDTSKIPCYSTNLSWLTRLSLLRYLNLGAVNLSKVADWPHVVNMIPSLRVLDLSNCELISANQSLPHLNLTNLEELDLSDNHLAHPIESCWFSNLTSLKRLNLEDNSLYGQFLEVLGDMASLQVLELSLNEMNIKTTNLTTLCNLRVLHLDRSFSYGNIAELTERLPQCSSNKLQELSLRGNNLIGILPNWFGGRFTSLVILDISFNNITGPLPAFIGNLPNDLYDVGGGEISSVGQTSPPLFSLQHLEQLDLSENNLTGPVPSDIGMLNNLTYLYLGSNNLDGVITHEHFACLTSLKIIDLSGNALKIVVDPEWLPPFRLEYASFQTCQMGPLFPHWLKWQVDIVDLDISIAGITDALPDWFVSTFSNASRLDLSSNGINGSLPTNMEAMTSLRELYLNSNKLTGKIPQLPINLTMLDLSSNGINGSLPTNMEAMTSLRELYLNSNKLTGQIPQLPINLTMLDLSSNGINGSLLTNMEAMTSLTILNLHSNKLTGQIPQLPIYLTFLDLSKNYLSGPLPANFGAPYISDLFLFSNLITGHIPRSICELQDLNIFNIADNLLEGEFPQCFEPTMNPKALLLSNNRFSGKFPSFLQICTELIVLDLAWNNFSGRLPMWIGNCVNLEIVRLSHNMFSESIPATITNLTRLAHLNLADNRISGVLPRHFSNFTGMTGRCIPTRYVLVSNLTVIMKGQERYYDDSEIYYMVSIDLSSNYLTGEIPEDIASLDAVINLNLSRNYLSGKIPGRIGIMQSLESLDFSRNKLYGEIPLGLSNLTYLGYMDLSYNNLTGRIPAGRQLDTLYTENPSMYNGNDGLCGRPLQKNCLGDSASKHGVHSERDSELKFFYFGFGLGFVVGLWVVFCAILFKKACRIAYFRLFDKVYDKMYVCVVVKWASLAQKMATH